MQYDSYREKVKRVAGVLGKMYAHRLLILIALVAMTLIAAVLVMTKGLLVMESDCPSEVTYGDKLGFRAGFVVAGTHYEYREQGSTAWSEKTPIFPGRYQVRAWGKSSFGEKTYTEIYDFTIVPRELTLTVTDTTVEYGEYPRVKAENLARGDKASCEVAFTDYGSANTTAYANISTLRITDKKGNDRMAGYTIREVEKVSIRFKPRPLTVTVRNASKVYDDTALSFDGYEITKGSLLAGDNLVAVFHDTLVDAGTKSNTPTLRIYNASGTDVTGFYSLTIKSGKLTVEKRPLIVQTGSVSYKYAGHELDYRNFTLDPSTSPVSGHYLEVTSAATILDCGSVENVLTFAVRNRRGVEETHNYSVFVKAGTLSMTPREVTVETLSETLVYNGTDQSGTQAYIQNGVGDEYRAVNPSTRRDVGSTENRFTVEFYRGEKNITSNYIIKGYQYGTLTIEPRPIEVRMSNDTKVYDGTPLTAGRFTVNSVGVGRYGLVQGHTLTLQAEGSVVFGTAENRYIRNTAEIRDANGTDVTGNYRVNVIDGTLTVTPRPITVSTPGDSKIYDGTPLTRPTWELKLGTLLKGHELFAVSSGVSITEVGTVDNTLETHLTRVTDTAGGEDVSQYYEISYALGTLRITRRPITVETPSDEWMYDSVVHMGSAQLILSEGTLVSGHSLDFESYDPVTIVNAGQIKNQHYARVISPEGDVTHNYSITYNFGTLTVHKRPIRVRAGFLTVTYDGSPHTTTELTLAADSPYPLATRYHELRVQDGDKLFFTEAGSYINDPRVSVYDAQSGVYVTANYDITRYDGAVTIQKRPLSICVNGEKTYDGKPLNNWYVQCLDGTSLAAGHTVTVKPQYVPTDAETVTSVIISDSVSITDGGGHSVLRNYTVVRKAGTLTVHKRPISIKTADAEKIYDGWALTAYDITVTPDSLPLVAGHEIIMVVNGRATEVGQYPNTCYPQTFSVAKDGIDITHNYELISVTEGTLTVKYDTAITVTTGSATKPFDGLPLTSDEYAVEITRGQLPEGYAVYVNVTGRITQPGSAENSAVVTVRDAKGNDATALFTVDLRRGVLTVTDELQDDTVFGRVYTNADGRVYLRMTSYGDYNGKGWNTAAPYGGTLTGGYSPNLLPSAALKNLGVGGIQTLRFSSMKIFMLPYYTEISDSNPLVGSDTDYTDTLRESYSVTYYPMGDPLALLEAFNRAPSYLKPFLLGSYAGQEQTYRRFVYDEYLTIDGETKAFMDAVIAAQGFDKSAASVIGDVAEYIRKAAKYDPDYDPALDGESNMAIAFLRDYREGVCVHYATAATLLYRALGIPARYVTGFMLDVKGGQWNEIKSPGYAWVEVYVDGLGWIQVDVTGSADNPDVPDIPDIPVTPPDTQKPELVLIPAFRHKVYDGTYLYASDELMLTPDLEALLKLGYTYTVRVSGLQKEIGDGVSVVGEFTLYDPEGKDVTNRFRLVKQSGLLRVTAPAAEVLLYPLTKTYDGRPAVWSEGDYTILTLPDGAILTLTVTVPADRLGYVTLAELNRNISAYVSYRLTRNGADVTADYPLVFTLPEGMEDTPVLTVNPRPLELTAASETRVDDGRPLENATVYLTKGTLAAGHTIIAEAKGTQTGVGSCANEVGSVTILDENRQDVTALYSITRVKGALTLLRGE